MRPAWNLVCPPGRSRLFCIERIRMNKVNQLAAWMACAVVLAAAGGVRAQVVDNHRATDGTVWKNGTNELCWRDNFWTPQTGVSGCDGVSSSAAVTPPPVAAVPATPAPAPVVAAPAVVAPAPVVVAPPPPPVTEKVTFAADAFFDTGKSVLKADGQAKLEDLVDKVQAIKLEVIVAVGHTDSVGSETYNQTLSTNRAEAVKSFLVGKGLDADRIFTEGKGKGQPVADNQSEDGRAKNRRVEIEVVGTRTRN